MGGPTKKSLAGPSVEVAILQSIREMTNEIRFLRTTQSEQQAEITALRARNETPTATTPIPSEVCVVDPSIIATLANSDPG